MPSAVFFYLSIISPYVSQTGSIQQIFMLVKQPFTTYNSTILKLAKRALKLHTLCQQIGIVLNTEKTNIMLIATRQKWLRIHGNYFTFSYENIDLQIPAGNTIFGVSIVCDINV